MQVSPYLFFSGNCEEAFNFYARCLNGKIEAMMTHAGTPAENGVPPEWRNKIIHARLTVGEEVLMGADAPPEHYHGPNGFSVSLQLKDLDEAERVFNALAQDGKVQMPFAQTFWARRFGMCVDRFGIPWMINCE